MNKLENIGIWAVLLTVTVAALIFINAQFNVVPVGSIETGQEYQSTTTPTTANGGTWNDQRLHGESSAVYDVSTTTWGTLGSVIITKSGDDMEFMLLDSTTTLALSDHETSTVLIAHFPDSATVGTYVFDVEFTNGLFLDVMGTGNGTTTFTFR